MSTISGKMTSGPPWRHVINFSLPVLAGSLLQQLYNTADTIIVGNFSGEKALSAVGTTGSFTFLFLAIAIGISSGNGVLVAQHYGAGDTNGVRRNASTGIVMMLTLGAISALTGFLAARPVYRHLINVPPDFLELTVTYFRIYSLGLVFQFGYNIFSSVLRALGDSRATLYFLLISSLLNIVLDLVFVAVLHLGVAGAAWATNIAQAVSFAAAYIYMSSKYPALRFGLRDLTCSRKLIADTMKVGFPISLQLIIVSCGFTLIQRAVNGFGQVMTASFTVGQRIEMYLNLPCHAFQTTLATYTGQNIGAKKPWRIASGMWQTLAISLGITIFISALVWMAAPQITAMFGLGDTSAQYCLSHLRAAAMCNIVLSVYIPLFGVFQGAKHSAFPMLVAFSALGARVAVTYMFRHSSFLGHTVIWWNGIFGFAVGFMVTWAYYFSRHWMKGTEQILQK